MRRLSKRSKGGRIIIALLGDKSDAVTPGTIDITTVIGNFGSVVDFIVETAIENSRAEILKPATAPASIAAS